MYVGAITVRNTNLEACVAGLGTKEARKPSLSLAGTDLRIDWADACSVVCNGQHYFLLVVDKDTQYLANFNTKIRHNPVDLLGLMSTQRRNARGIYVWMAQRNSSAMTWWNTAFKTPGSCNDSSC